MEFRFPRSGFELIQLFALDILTFHRHSVGVAHLLPLLGVPVHHVFMLSLPSDLLFTILLPDEGHFSETEAFLLQMHSTDLSIRRAVLQAVGGGGGSSTQYQDFTTDFWELKEGLLLTESFSLSLQDFCVLSKQYIAC